MTASASRSALAGPRITSPPANRMAEFMLAVALVTAVLQFQEVLPFAPLSVWWLLIAAVPVFIGGFAPPRGLVWLALVIALANVVVSTWSPAPLEALRMAANFVALAVAAGLTSLVLSSGTARLKIPLAWAAPALILQSAITILFFFSPDLEAQYLQWPFAKYFSGGGVELLYTSQFNNVLFPEKAGGFFLNGNTASMFMATAAWLYFAIGVRTRTRWMIVVALISLAGAVGTGSKTALLLGGVSVIVVVLLAALRRNFLVGALVLMLVPIAALVAVDLLSSSAALNQDAGTTLGSRGRIWTLAWSGISRSPIAGLGYGGWIDLFTAEGGFIGFDQRPAHNFVLQAWLDGGVVYLVLVITLALFSIVVGLRALAAAGTGREALAASSMVMSVVWVFAHGLADNTWVYGEWHSLPFFAIAVVTAASWSMKTEKPDIAGRRRLDPRSTLAPTSGA